MGTNVKFPVKKPLAVWVHAFLLFLLFWYDEVAKKNILRRTFCTLSRRYYELKLKNIRSNRSSMFFKIGGALKNLANFTGKQLCWSLFLMKLQAFRLRTSMKSVNVKENLFVT